MVGGWLLRSRSGAGRHLLYVAAVHAGVETDPCPQPADIEVTDR